MNCSCCRHQVLRVSPHVNICNFTWQVHPQSTEKQTWTKTFHQWIHFCHVCLEHGVFDVFTVVVNKTWVARREISLAVTWAVSPACEELSHHQLSEKLPLKHIWRTCCNTETVSCFVTNLSVPEHFCTLYALQGYSGDLLLCSFRLGSPPILQLPFSWLTSKLGPTIRAQIISILIPGEFALKLKLQSNFQDQHGKFKCTWNWYVIINWDSWKIKTETEMLLTRLPCVRHRQSLSKK